MVRCGVATISLGTVLLFASANAQAQIGISWSPLNPEIGDNVIFTITGIAGTIEKATWNFGEEGCEKPSIGVCEPHPIYGGSCASFTFAYASGGTKAVYVDLELAGGGTDTAGPVTVDVTYIGDCAINPSISFSPSNPEIGETVVFAIEGVSVDIKKAYWNMGGPGCDGTDSTPTCIPTLWNNCKTQAYKYSSSGTKTVSLSIEVGGDTFITFIAPPVQVSVALSGSCPGDPIFADGFESGDLWAWSSSQPPPPPCVHDACDNGVALDPQCDPCVAQICAVDDFCCTDLWDRTCVDQVASVCGQICHSCDHFFCDTGSALDPSCHPCVEDICAVDDFCCTTLWDRDCVGAVPTTCGLTCD